jgi:hypothetical protein
MRSPSDDQTPSIESQSPQRPMTIPTPRAALKAEPEGPTMAEEALVALDRIQRGDTSSGSDDFDLVANALGQLRRWDTPATPPAPEPGEQPVSQPYELPEPGEMPSDELMGQWRNAALAEYRSGGEPTWRTSALLAITWARQQQATELAALRGLPVALSEWEDAFMGGVCAALATVTAHGDSVIWREIVRSVGVDNALNYAANVNPEDWELAGFSNYAQPELGKDKPRPAPQAGEGEA